MTKAEMIELDAFHQHEALDRLHVACEMIDTHIAEHPYVKQNPEVSVRVQNALSNLFNAYQLVGNDAIRELKVKE